MIVIGADTHKSSHTLVAVDATSGQRLAVVTVASTSSGAFDALGWARRVAADGRVWAVEDCRPVSGRLERSLGFDSDAGMQSAPRLRAGDRGGGRNPRKNAPITSLA